MPPMTKPGLSSSSQPQSNALKSYLAGKPFNSKWNAYYSRVRIACTSGGAGSSFVCASGNEFLGFGYSRGADMGPAGQAGHIATYADTNIQTPSQTVAGEAVEVDGVGLILLTSSDANFAKALDPNVSVKIRLNGSTDYPMGIPSMLPGPGGLFGASESLSVVPDQISQAGIVVGAMSNGIPHVTNFFPLPEPMIWSSAGKADSTINVILRTESTTTTIANYSGASRTAVAGGSSTPGTAVYTVPLFGVIFVDYMIVICGRTVLPLSDN
jgi:hypothetical protein